MREIKKYYQNKTELTNTKSPKSGFRYIHSESVTKQAVSWIWKCKNNKNSLFIEMNFQIIQMILHLRKPPNVSFAECFWSELKFNYQTNVIDCTLD